MATGRLGRLRVLALLPFAPRFDSPHGGRATAEFLIRLARRHDVALLCLREPGEPQTEQALRDTCAFVEEAELSGPSSNDSTDGLRRRRRLWGLLRGSPMQVSEWRSSLFERRARALVESFAPDILHVEPLAMAQYLDVADSAAPIVLVAHEPVAQTADEILRSSHGIDEIVRWLDRRAWYRFERETISRADAVVVLTERDRRALEAAAAGTHVVTIPLGVEISPEPLDPVGTPPPSILFVGGYGHLPNVEAALRLGREILPRVRERRPDAVLHLVGDRPPKAVRELANDGIVVTGRVPDVRPFLDAAAVVVAPLRMGGGMRNKVLEALAAGKAVVASGLAAAGLNAEEAQQLRLAETDSEFAAAIVELLQDEEARRALAGGARRWSEAHLGWDERVDTFEGLYRSLLESPGRLDAS
jgi:glycosyltransferase involved in cell wall biosynthesis